MMYHSVCLSVKHDDLVMIVDVCNMLMYRACRATYWMDTFKMRSISSVPVDTYIIAVSIGDKTN